AVAQPHVEVAPVGHMCSREREPVRRDEKAAAEAVAVLDENGGAERLLYAGGQFLRQRRATSDRDARVLGFRERIGASALAQEPAELGAEREKSERVEHQGSRHGDRVADGNLAL